MKKILIVLMFSVMVGFAVPASAQHVVIGFPFPAIVVGFPVITIGPAYPPQPVYMMPPAPYPHRYNSYRTGSYQDYYLPPSPHHIYRTGSYPHHYR